MRLSYLRTTGPLRTSITYLERGSVDPPGGSVRALQRLPRRTGAQVLCWKVRRGRERCRSGPESRAGPPAAAVAVAASRRRLCNSEDTPPPSCIHICSQALSSGGFPCVSSDHPSITARLLPWRLFKTKVPPPLSLFGDACARRRTHSVAEL